MPIQVFRRPPQLLFAPSVLLDLAVLVLVSTILLLALPPTQTVMQITLPVRELPTPRPNYIIRFTLPKPAELRRMRNWQIVQLTGNNQADSISMLRLWKKLAHMQRFPNNTTGVAVRFGPRAGYGRVIDVLDCINQWDVRKYYLDIHSPVTALYAFTDARQAPVTHDVPYQSDVFSTSAPADTATTATGRWVQQVSAPLHHKAWGTAVLACIGLAAVGVGVYLIRELS